MARGMPSKTCMTCRTVAHARTKVCGKCGTGFAAPKLRCEEPVFSPPVFKKDATASAKSPEGKGATPLMELIVPAGPIPAHLTPVAAIEQWVRDVKAYYYGHARLLTYSAASYVLRQELGFALGQLARDKPELFQGTSI